MDAPHRFGNTSATRCNERQRLRKKPLTYTRGRAKTRLKEIFAGAHTRVMSAVLASPCGIKRNHRRRRRIVSARRHYNYFRDYDSATDREIESDPMGLGGGISTYAYAYENPLSFADPYGLKPGDVFWNPDCAAQDMAKFLADNSASRPGSALFQSNFEYSNDVLNAPGGGYTYANNFKTIYEGHSVDPNSQPPNYFAHFHSHTMMTWLDDSPTDFSAGDLSLADNKNEYVGGLVATGSAPSARFPGSMAPTGSRLSLHKRSIKSPKSVPVSTRGCGCVSSTN